MRGYRPWEVSHLFSHEISRRMPSESCLGTAFGPSYEQFGKTCVFRKGRKGRDPLSSDLLSSDALSSDPLSSDPLSSDPLSSDPLISDIETILFRAGTKTVQKQYISTKAVQKRGKNGTKTIQKRYIITKTIQKRYKSCTKAVQKRNKNCTKAMFKTTSEASIKGHLKGTAPNVPRF